MTGKQRNTVSEFALHLGAKISNKLMLGVLILSSVFVLTYSVLHYQQQGNFFVRGVQGYLTQLIRTNDFFELNRHFKSFLKDQAFAGAWLYRDTDQRLIINAVQESASLLNGSPRASEWWFSGADLTLFFHSRYPMILSPHDSSYTLILAQKINMIPIAIALALAVALVLLLNTYIRKVLDRFSHAITQPLQGFISHLRGIASADDFRKLHSREAEFEEIAALNDQFAAMNTRLAASEKQAKDNLRLATIGAVASQVAHDIRSPLAALSMATSHLQELPEDTRLLVRSAVQRIHDIANDLAGKKAKASDNDQSSPAKSEPSLELLSGIVDTLVSEKRLQYRARINVEIDAEIGTSSYGLFAKIQPVEFKRVLSNLINNAVEVLPNGGKVAVKLYAQDDAVKIQVTDTGQGIPPEILSRLMQRGETHGKAGGSGLGLYHARTSFESWGGTVEISSTVGFGTTVTVTLPKHDAPEWFVPELRIIPQSTIVILDDDNSIHQIWKGRFESADPEHQIKLLHFSMPNELIAWYQELNGNTDNVVFLCDYEFIGHDKTGINVIRELGLREIAILVTSRFEEDTVRRGCEELGVRLIPKNLAGFVPISVGADSRHQHIQTSAHPHDSPNVGTIPVATANHEVQPSVTPDAILIDDDQLVHMNWKMAAKRKNKILRVYTGPDEFWRDANTFGKATPIYVDSNLGNGTKGEDVTWLMDKKGYGNLFLATGTNADQFDAMPWVKGIVGKGPPWL